MKLNANVFAASFAVTVILFWIVCSALVYALPGLMMDMTEATGHPIGSPYRIGLFETKIQGHIGFGHGGFWGTDVFVVPELDVSISEVALNASGINDLRQLESDLIERYFAAK